jgi:hypothetical protein
MLRGFLILLLVLTLTGAIIWWLLGTQQADPTYVPQVVGRTWTNRRPTVVIDDRHWNAHTSVRGYAPFARLLAADGYATVEAGSATLIDALQAADVLVIANPLGIRGVIRQMGQLVGLSLDPLAADAFGPGEVEDIDTWVRDGGSLLLVADQKPAGRAAQTLAERFGVEMLDDYAIDPDRTEGDGTIVFSRDRGTLGRHPILDGRSNPDRVNRVVTFTGQALRGPPHATPLLLFSQSAYSAPSQSESAEQTSIARLAQGVALTHRRGRVVVLGEANVITSQLASMGGQNRRVGLAWPNADNERFARNIMRWLSRQGE